MLYQRHSREVWALAYALAERGHGHGHHPGGIPAVVEAMGRGRTDPESAGTWLLRVARNLAEDHAKSAFRRNGTHPPQTMNGVQAHEPLPLETLEQAETFAQLRKGMDQLPCDDREILTFALRPGLHDGNDRRDALHQCLGGPHAVEPGSTTPGGTVKGPGNRPTLLIVGTCLCFQDGRRRL